jgi:hypothetical protein
VDALELVGRAAGHAQARAVRRRPAFTSCRHVSVTVTWPWRARRAAPWGRPGPSCARR